jgi:hypothetical protein
VFRRFVPFALALIACGGASRGPAVAPVAPARPTGAILLAHPGTSLPFAVGANEVVRGRVRYHIDGEVAVRARDVLVDAVSQAIALPAHLGGGIALIGDQGIAIATTASIRPVVRAQLAALSVGARELWARERGTVDWVRIDVGKGTAAREAPPIAAPILTTWSTMGSTAGRPNTTGPEFAQQNLAVALVDLLGPVISRDEGQTWSPLAAATVRASFPFNGPSRVVRDGTNLMLASDDRLVPLVSSGALGASLPMAPTFNVPDAAALRLELVAPFGVPLPSGDLLIADGPRLAIVDLDPVRVMRAVRSPDLTRCDLVPSVRDVAVAACVRHHEGTGGQLAIGTVGEDARFIADRTFPFGSSHRLSPTSAVIVSATCTGTSEGGIDLMSTSKVCVRDAEGKWNDVGLPQIVGRRHVIGLSNGGVAMLREDNGGRAEIVLFPRGATATTIPLRLHLDDRLRDIIGFDESAPHRLTLWRRTIADLRALTIDVTEGSLQYTEGPRAILNTNAVVGTHGDHAMIATLIPKGAAPATIEASITTDGGRTWGTRAWPDEVRPLDVTLSGRRIECGAAGCRLFGWTRIGWQKTVASHDKIVALDEAPALPPAPAHVARSHLINARCTTQSPPQTIAATAVPLAGPSFPQTPNDVLLGLPPPKVPKDHSMVLTPFAGRGIRGGFVTVGPTSGPWADKARSFIRFATDLDPLGTVHETQTFAAPFADRMSAQLVWGYARQIDAFPLGPGRIAYVWCGPYNKCEISRVVTTSVPQKVDLGGVGLLKMINAREMGDTLAILATGTRADSTAPGRVLDPLPFVALIDPHGTTTAFFARADESRLSLTADRTRGAFAIRATTPAPSWTDGTSYVLPLGTDGKPAGAFEKLIASSVEISRPTAACGVSAPGWDEADLDPSRAVHVRIDGAEPASMGLAGALRSRLSSSNVCLDRITAMNRNGSFQLDPSTGRAVFYLLDADGKGGKRTELSCTMDWQL